MLEIYSQMRKDLELSLEGYRASTSLAAHCRKLLLYCFVCAELCFDSSYSYLREVPSFIVLNVSSDKKGEKFQKAFYARIAQRESSDTLKNNNSAKSLMLLLIFDFILKVRLAMSF